MVGTLVLWTAGPAAGKAGRVGSLDLTGTGAAGATAHDVLRAEETRHAAEWRRPVLVLSISYVSGTVGRGLASGIHRHPANPPGARTFPGGKGGSQDGGAARASAGQVNRF